MRTKFLLDLVAPRYCLSCLRFSRAYLCSACAGALPFLYQTRCPFCLKPAATGSPLAVCETHRTKTSLNGFVAATFYEGLAETLVQTLKYRGVADAAQDLAACMARSLTFLSASLREYTLVPVPLSPDRERERGFNQSALIARSLAEMTGLPCNETCLIKTRRTKPQAQTRSVAERLENLRECFRASAAPRRVLLIDDVRTTGVTLEECARALKSAGARRVVACTFALTKR